MSIQPQRPLDRIHNPNNIGIHPIVAPYACYSTLVATMTDQRDILEYSHPKSRRVQDVKIQKLLGVIWARVRKRDVNTNVPTIHPSPLITPKITISYSHALPATCSSSSRGSLDHERRLMVSRALAEETGRLRTWRLSIDSHSSRPPIRSIPTPQKSLLI